MQTFASTVLILATCASAADISGSPSRLMRKEAQSLSNELLETSHHDDQDEAIPQKFYGYVARRHSEADEASLLELPAIPQIELPSSLPYNLYWGTEMASYSQWNQDVILAPILDQIKHGFFVESGARDGEEHSNSLYYELKKGWRGLLVEPSQREYPKIAGKHRKAYSFQGCISPTSKPETLHFSDSGDGLSHIDKTSSFVSTAYPLLTLLQAVNQTTVDFWSLDVEGSEGSILKATDFSKVEVGLLLIEMNKSPENNAEIEEVMTRNGFVDIGKTRYDGGWLDHIFVNPKYFTARGLQVPGQLST